MNDLLSLSVLELQNATDRLIAPQTVRIWQQYLNIMFEDIPEAKLDLLKDRILTSKPDIIYLEHIVEFISQTSLLEMELYIWWSVVEELVLHTSSDIRKLHNDYAQTITNLEGGTPRSLYCTAGVNQLMGMAVSYAIADSYFIEHTRPKVITMLNNIREAFNNLVRRTTWMDDGTKCSTLEKSLAMKSLIGFPDWILDPGKLDEFYGGIKFNETTHLRNMMDLLAQQMVERLRSLRIVEEFTWGTTPTNVNAFHTFQANAISKYFLKKLYVTFIAYIFSC